MISSGASVEMHYPNEEPAPASVACSIHPWMKGYVLVRANPYMGLSDKDGQFQIKNLPVGKHPFRFWHERAGWLRDVKIGSHTTDAKGRLTVTIRSGDNDLGDNDLKEAKLNRKKFRLPD